MCDYKLFRFLAINNLIGNYPDISIDSVLRMESMPLSFVRCQRPLGYESANKYTNLYFNKYYKYVYIEWCMFVIQSC